MPRYTVDEVIKRGKFILARHPTYSQDARGANMFASQYDCSSFMGVINGVGEGGWPPATPGMVAAYTASGYIHYIYGLVTLKKGDILVWNKPGTSGQGDNGHTAMYIGGGQLIQCTGGIGVRICPFYNLGWQDVLRNPRSGLYITKWQPTDGKGGGFSKS